MSRISVSNFSSAEGSFGAAGAGFTSRLICLIIRKRTRAMISELTGFPDKLMKRFEKSTLPRKIPRNGMSRLLTAELTILQKCGANNADGKVN